MEFFGAKRGWESIDQSEGIDDSGQITLAEKMMRLASRVVELHLSQAAPPTQEQVDAIVMELL